MSGERFGAALFGGILSSSKEPNKKLVFFYFVFFNNYSVLIHIKLELVPGAAVALWKRHHIMTGHTLV